MILIDVYYFVSLYDTGFPKTILTVITPLGKLLIGYTL
jgi:hypothetical protein